MINSKLILKIILLVSMTVMFTITACDSDDPVSSVPGEHDNGGNGDNGGGGGDGDTSNSFTYDGTTFTLGSGEVEDYGDYLEGYRNYDFWLYENTSTNSSYVIYFELFSLGESSFGSGTYSYSSTPVQGNFFEYADLYFPEMETYLEVTGGDVEVAISGNTYTLVFDLMLDDGKSLVGGLTFDFQLSKIVTQELKLHR